MTTQKMFLTMHPRPTTMWITGSSKAPSLARQHCQRPGGRLIQGTGQFLLGAGKHPTKKHTATYGSKTHISPALAVGGKLTKRVLGSFACLGDGARSGRVLAGYRPGDVTRRLPGCRMTRPYWGKVESRLFLSNGDGKGVPLTLCYVLGLGTMKPRNANK